MIVCRCFFSKHNTLTISNYRLHTHDQQHLKFTIMKKILYCLMACMFLMLGSCQKDPVNNNDNTENGGEEPNITASILGHWKLDSAIQTVGGNDIDITNFYGVEFHLIFEEDGTLITTDGINENPMQWALEGDQLAFIQAPGLDPVMYLVKKLNKTQLIIENGTGTEYVTVMTLHRVE